MQGISVAGVSLTRASHCLAVIAPALLGARRPTATMSETRHAGETRRLVSSDMTISPFGLLAHGFPPSGLPEAPITHARWQRGAAVTLVRHFGPMAHDRLKTLEERTRYEPA